jgi:IstB-like ATP binding protein
VGEESREHLRSGTDRRREKLHRLCAGAKGVPRRVYLLARLSRIDALVIDDWAMAPLSETERRDFWEICEDRYQSRSLILTSQLPVTRPADDLHLPRRQLNEKQHDETLQTLTRTRILANIHQFEYTCL